MMQPTESHSESNRSADVCSHQTRACIDGDESRDLAAMLGARHDSAVILNASAQHMSARSSHFKRCL
ncbi:hypothetical protein [Duganella sp. BuS-21]|uniref:hypothetical protein n=1 Tax=Duganella sp. BuS-21 TaxID=2943848 RepID=UPI0035A693DF